LKILRLISTAIRIIATNVSSIRKIEAETINILADELSFPCIGGSLCELEDITGVGGVVIVGVGPGILVATGVEVGTFILGVGLA